MFGGYWRNAKSAHMGHRPQDYTSTGSSEQHQDKDEANRCIYINFVLPLKFECLITATQSFALKAYGRPEDGPKNHRITTLFVIPVAVQGQS